jgi:hypothetical protein
MSYRTFHHEIHRRDGAPRFAAAPLAELFGSAMPH